MPPDIHISQPNPKGVLFLATILVGLTAVAGNGLIHLCQSADFARYLLGN